MENKTLKRHLEAIQSGTVSKSNIVGIRKAINHTERLNNGWPGNRSSATVEEVWELEEAIAACQPRADASLTESGLAVLRNPRYKSRWQVRQKEAIGAADHFKLAGFMRIGERGQYGTPVWTLWAKVPPEGDRLDGATYEAFHFINIPWQSGGNGPQVVQDGEF